jgi:MscS family membrane protein
MPKTRLSQFRIGFLNASVIFFSVFLIVLQTLLYLADNGYIYLPAGIALMFRHISVVIAALFVTSLVLRLTIKRLFRLFDEPEESIFYTKIYSWTLYSISIFAILHYFGVSLGNITIFLGLIATGLAFAIRDVLLSFFGWMILLRKNPFRIGDYIRLGEDEGKVIHIGTFYVLLDNTPDIPQDFIRVPNRLFLEKSIYNLGKSIYHDQIKFQLSKMPDNPGRLLPEIQKQVRLAAGNSEYALAYLDIQNEKLLLNVEYLIRFEKRKEKRSDVIQKVFSLLGESVLVPKG